METINLIEHLLLIFNETVWPLVGVWLVYVARRWMEGKLKVPPHVLDVSIEERKPK